jgi:hypothetical protein
MTTQPLGLGQVSSNGSASDVAEALAGGTSQRVGAFRFYFDDQRWEWSEQVQRMHGYQPGTVTPTTELVLAHKHPEDRDQIAQTLDTIRRTGQPLSSQHRARRPLRCRPVVNRLGGQHVVVLFIHAVLGQSQRIETSEGDAQILCRPATIGTRLCVAVGTPGGWWVDRS